MFMGNIRVGAVLICALAVMVGPSAWAASNDKASQADLSKPSEAGAMQWLDQLNVEFSVTAEVEVGYVDDSRQAGDRSDITLATVEIGVDVAPLKHASAHVLFLFEEGDTDPIDLDEAYIRLDGEDKMPFHLTAGRQYLPFCNFDSDFISDPLTLELGETRESSVVVGYGNELLDFSVGFFNGDVEQAGDQDDHIDGYAAGIVFAPNTGERFGLATGLSYISNIGESDALQGEDGIDVDAGNTIESDVAGLAAFVSANVMQILFLQVEVVAALETFGAGELAFDNSQASRPVTYNAELRYQINDQFAAGIRVAGANDGGDFLPETQYGAVVSYCPFEKMTLGIECQYSEFDTPDDNDLVTVTAQLGVEF